MAIRVTVIYSPAPREVHEWTVTLEEGACVLAALEASGLSGLLPQAQWEGVPVGIWGRQAGFDHPLRERDRIEVYRPLLVDPKVARRERFRKQGARGAGLFAKKRAGGKAGY
jgi:putative ubiquitin-RnfH superfamily antitoxin RatB of RatAB toxin-antitoxin module